MEGAEVAVVVGLAVVEPVPMVVVAVPLVRTGAEIEGVRLGLVETEIETVQPMLAGRIHEIVRPVLAGRIHAMEMYGKLHVRRIDGTMLRELPTEMEDEMGVEVATIMLTLEMAEAGADGVAGTADDVDGVAMAVTVARTPAIGDMHRSATFPAMTIRV